MSDVWIVLISISAAWVLSVFTPAANRWLTKKRRRRALALLVCPLLEQFMLDCQAAIDDEGQRRKGNRHPSVPMPTGPEFPPEVDWASIDPRLANRVQWLRSAATRADQELRHLAEELHDPPENEPWFSHRRTRCHRLLYHATKLSFTLREVAGLPAASDDPFDNMWASDTRSEPRLQRARLAIQRLGGRGAAS